MHQTLPDFLPGTIVGDGQPFSQLLITFFFVFCFWNKSKQVHPTELVVPHEKHSLKVFFCCCLKQTQVVNMADVLFSKPESTLGVVHCQSNLLSTTRNKPGGLRHQHP